MKKIYFYIMSLQLRFVIYRSRFEMKYWLPLRQVLHNFIFDIKYEINDTRIRGILLYRLVTSKNMKRTNRAIDKWHSYRLYLIKEKVEKAKVRNKKKLLALLQGEQETADNLGISLAQYQQMMGITDD